MCFLLASLVSGLFLPEVALGYRAHDEALVASDEKFQTHAQMDEEQKAKRTFEASIQNESWKYRGVEGPDTLHCIGDGHSLEYSFVRGIGAGAQGATVLMTRGTSDVQVVAKLPKPVAKNDPSADSFKECNILRHLERHDVPNVLRCEARCEISGHAIITTPFLPESMIFTGQLDPDKFDSALAAEKATLATLQTARLMLRAHVINSDQRNNILYTKNGTTLFIDFGIAMFFGQSLFTKGSETRLLQFFADMRQKVPWELKGSKQVAEAIKLLRDEVDQIIATIPELLRMPEDVRHETMQLLKID